MSKNHGLLIAPPKPSDYILGVKHSLLGGYEIADQTPYLPDAERQYSDQVDFLDCTTFSAIHNLETTLNYLFQKGLLSSEAQFFFRRYGYIQNNKVKLSVRFSAQQNGTDKTKGQYQNVAAEQLHTGGAAPDKALPMTASMSWAEYYAPVSPALIEVAKKFLWFFKIEYQWVPKSALAAAFTVAPVQVATEVCPGWDSGLVVAHCSGEPIQHATILYGQNSEKDWLDFDQYPPFFQKLAPDYELPYNMQYIVTMKTLVLRNGMTGENVRELQKNLTHLGYPLSVDGSFGTHTEGVVVAFQKDHTLSADGLVGPATQRKISELLIRAVAYTLGIEPELAVAVAQCESGLNPKCTNTNTNGSIDKGLYQWNDQYHPEISELMAFDIETATTLFCQAVKAGKLQAFWSASLPCWKQKLSPDILAKYHIV